MGKNGGVPRSSGAAMTFLAQKRGATTGTSRLMATKP